uniref:TNFR-Cys domain-containing protein n=1 Tax=Magallana gigas TaxID=29159 RepID=A0A8W8MLH9_MAGGI
MSVVLIIFPLTWTPVLSLCGSYVGPVCCAGTYWNDETSSCEKCPLGYHDINCSRICTYPTFGKRCQDLCDCKPSECTVSFESQFLITPCYKPIYTAFFNNANVLTIKFT